MRSNRASFPVLFALVAALAPLAGCSMPKVKGGEASESRRSSSSSGQRYTCASCGGDYGSPGNCPTCGGALQAGGGGSSGSSTRHSIGDD